MKRIIPLLLALFFLKSCSTTNDNGFFFEISPVESVTIPSEFISGKAYDLTISYLKPSTCYAFYDFYYLEESNEVIIAPINYVFERNDCEALDNKIVEVDLNFIVTNNGPYIFKFWQG
ncbi:hypothetical protein, partial [Seonamhaeicola sp.]